ncbi:hypothetical protein ES708_23685 [subsurface metagenome]
MFFFFSPNKELFLINLWSKILIGNWIKSKSKYLSKSGNFNKIKTLINFEDLSIKDINIIDLRRWHFN